MRLLRKKTFYFGQCALNGEYNRSKLIKKKTYLLSSDSYHCYTKTFSRVRNFGNNHTFKQWASKKKRLFTYSSLGGTSGGAIIKGYVERDKIIKIIKIIASLWVRMTSLTKLKLATQKPRVTYIWLCCQTTGEGIRWVIMVISFI